MNTSDYKIYENIRKIFFIIILVITSIIPITSSAQHWMSKFEHLGNYPQIKAATEAYFSEDTSRISNKACGYKDFNRWMTFMESRVDVNGSLSTYNAAFNVARNQILESDGSNRIFTGWQSLGPLLNTHPSNAWLGLITSIWVDESNFRTIYAGSNSGGLFVTYDGGDNWSCLTDKYMVTGVESIEKNSLEPNTIYIATGYNAWGREYGVGVLKSTNNGVTWRETNLNAHSYPKSFTTKTIQNPLHPSTLFALVNFEFSKKGAKILRTYNGGNDWIETYDIPEDNRQDELFEIDMHPTDTSTYIVSGSVFLTTNDNGLTWSDNTNRIIDISTHRLVRASTAFHPIIQGKIIVVLEKENKITGNSDKDLLISTDNGISFTSIAGNVELMGYGYPKMEIEWSKMFQDQFYMGGWYIAKYRLLPGNTVENIQIGIPYHVDIREMKTYKDASGQGIIIQGNDGGITKGLETNTNVTWSDISKNGLNITQFYGIGIPSNNTDFIFGGTQDGNFERFSNGIWDKPHGGDAAEVIVNQQTNDTYVYRVVFMNGNNIIQKYGDSGSTTLLSVENTDPTRRNDAPLEKGNNYQTFYFGGTEVYRTTDDFVNIRKLSNFQSGAFIDYSNKLKTIRQAPSDHNTIYAARENPHWNCDTDSCDRRRLFKTTNGGANYNWTDITPTNAEFSLHDVGIFDIAVHPTNPNLIYIALDRNIAGKRVFRYNNGEWTNISDGLPNVPINCIKYYRRGTNQLNELFAGTDLGVYYRNDVINRWIPFGTGLPLVSVSDLEINSSTKEIVAATFGRGIYKANLCFDPQEITPTYVETTQTWDDKVLTNDVIINQGVVLTITGTVEMPPAKHIYVQKGGLLILDGGKITNACKGEQWGGINVYGTSTGPQTLNYQGMVEIKNNGTIENALIGIHCINATNEEGGSIGTSKFTGGGIILVNEAWFKNNSMSVVFEKYTTSSASRFKSCTFVINDELFTDATFNYFVRMNEVNGVTYTGCTFKNEQSSFAIADRGKGIYSNNSFFMVDQYILPPPFQAQKTIFNGLRYGIHAFGQKGGRTFAVANTLFENNESGIYASGTDLVNLKDNVFKMKNSSSQPPVASGIYLEKCTGYIIEENEFWTIDNNPFLKSYGVYINSSGEANNTIYKNKFYDNTYGITSQDQNRNKDGSAGLRLKCNEFNNVKMDIVIMKTVSNDIEMGIASSQGSNGGTCDTPAGNLFSNLAPSTGYYSIHNGGELVYYYHHNPSSEARVYPDVVTERYVSRQPTGHNYSIGCCPPSPSGGGGSSIIDGETAFYKSEAETTKATLSSLIDEGETSDKVLEVNLASPSEALDVRNSILQYSPFVSDTVLKSSINREELLNNAMIRDIMVANPHSAKSETLMQEVDMRLEPMPDYMKDEILEGVFVLSAKELMEAKRDMDMQFYNYGFNRLLSVSLTDTIPVPADTLMALLAADGSVESLMRQAWLLLENGDTTSALNRWSNISNEIPLTEAELTELSQQQVFMQWLVDNQPMDTLDTESLNNFLQYSSPVVTATARGILVVNNLLEYNEPYLEPDLTKSMELRKPGVKPINKETAYLKVFPNPAKDFITIEYNTGNDKIQGVIEIINESGRKVYNRNLGRQFDQIILDTRDLKSGSYIFRLTSGDKYIGSANVIISH
jgi:hypothetical protein